MLCSKIAKAKLQMVDKTVMVAIYFTQGVLQAPAVVACWEEFTRFEVTCLALMIVCYLVGAVIYARQQPALSPMVFGFHELWHLLITIAADRVTICGGKIAC